MRNYLNILEDILKNGFDTPNRTGVDTRTLLGCTFKHDMRNGFPAVTTKRLIFKSVIAENIWFLTGSRDEKYLKRLGTSIWEAWANGPEAEFNGDVGRIYGVQMRHRSVSLAYLLHLFNNDRNRLQALVDLDMNIRENNSLKYIEPLERLRSNKDDVVDIKALLSIFASFLRLWIKKGDLEVDQLKVLLEGLEKNPFSRRHIIDLWNPSELSMMSLPPCHLFYQFHVDNNRGLHLTMYQRSGDMFLGIPFNIAHCGIWLVMFAQALGLEPRTITLTIGNAHIYHNHFDQVKKQLSRQPKSLPSLWVSPKINKDFIINLKDNTSLAKNDVEQLINLNGYDYHPPIKAPIAV